MDKNYVKYLKLVIIITFVVLGVDSCDLDWDPGREALRRRQGVRLE